MTSIKRNTMLVLRFLAERDAYVLSKRVSKVEVKASLCLSDEEFDSTVDYLLLEKLVKQIGFGTDAPILLTSGGADQVDKYLQESYGLSLTAEQILGFAVEAERQEPGDFVPAGNIWNALKLTQQEYSDAALELSDKDFIKSRVGLREAPFLGINTTPEGREALRQDFRRQVASSEPSVSIGAVFGGDMTGGSLLAVGMADKSEISQIMSDPEKLRRYVDEIIRELADNVRAELSESGQFDKYLQDLNRFKEELLSDQPRRGRVKQLVGNLSLTANIEGTIALILRVWPYLLALLQCINIS